MTFGTPFPKGVLPCTPILLHMTMRCHRRNDEPDSPDAVSATRDALVRTLNQEFPTATDLFMTLQEFSGNDSVTLETFHDVLTALGYAWLTVLSLLPCELIWMAYGAVISQLHVPGFPRCCQHAVLTCHGHSCWRWFNPQS